MTVADLGSTAQLTAVNLVKDNAAKFADIPGADAAIEAIKGLNTNFLGIDLTQTPSISHINLIFFVPIIAGLSALLMLDPEQDQRPADRAEQARSGA